MNKKENEPSLPTITFPVQFVYQKGERYQPLIDQGIAESLDEAEFCWLASIDMAVSTRLPNPDERLEFMLSLAMKLRELGLLKGNGAIDTGGHEDEFLGAVNDGLASQGIPLELALKVLRSPRDIRDELLQGNMLLITVYNDKGYGHMLLMDKIFIDRERTEGVMSTWNPIAPSRDSLYAREFNGISQPYFLEQGRPNIIVPDAYVFRQLEI